MTVVYVLHHPARGVAKIGVAGDVTKRMAQLRGKHGALELAHSWTMLSTEAYRTEKALHWHFRRAHIEPRDWVGLRMAADSGSEWFRDSILTGIAQLSLPDVLAAYRGTQVYELRLAKADMTALFAKGLRVEDAIRLALQRF